LSHILGVFSQTHLVTLPVVRTAVTVVVAKTMSRLNADFQNFECKNVDLRMTMARSTEADTLALSETLI
jgi:hypothetical protein